MSCQTHGGNAYDPNSMAKSTTNLADQALTMRDASIVMHETNERCVINDAV
jgi:hypothetical protein